MSLAITGTLALATGSNHINVGDGGNLSGGTVSITGNYASGQDLLAMTPNPQNGISAAFNAGSRIATSTAMIATTTKSSISVNPGS